MHEEDTADNAGKTRDTAPTDEEELQLIPSSARLGPVEIAQLVEVASYLAAASAAGLAGNRADAAAMRLFWSVIQRWRERRAFDDATPLTIEEAIDAAKAAAQASTPGRLTTVSVTSARQGKDGSWAVKLWLIANDRGRRTLLRVIIPAGDPADAVIRIEVLKRSAP